MKYLLDAGKRGVVSGMPWEEYLKVPAVNPSRLVDSARSMLHFLNSEALHDKPDRQMAVGRAAHCWILEKERFPDLFAVYTGLKNRNSREYKNFCQENPGKEIITKKEFGEAAEIGQAVCDDPVAKGLLDGADTEVSVFSEECGLQVKGRVDAVTRHVIDIKTTTNIHRMPFGRVFARLKYGMKLACYHRWLCKEGREVDGVYVVTVESRAPWDVAVVPVPESVLAQGWMRADALLRSVRDAIDTDEWPGVARGELYDLDVPMWDMDEEDVFA